jgi:AraC-like DNA-binding protein
MSSALRARLRRAPISYTRVVQFQCESGPPDSLKRYTREQKASLHFRHDRVLTLQVDRLLENPPPISAMTVSRSPAGASDFARVGPLRPLLSILADAGISAQAVFDQADIELSLFQDPDNRIPFEAAGRLLETSARLARLPDLGLRLGRAGRLANFGRVGEYVRTAATVGDALRAFVECFAFQDSGGVLMLLPMPLGNVAFAYSMHMANTPGRQQIQDMAIGLGCNVLNELCGSAWRPSYVQFAHARTAEPRPHLASICANPVFDAEVTAIVFPARWMDRTLPHSEPERHAVLGHELTVALLTDTQLIADKVRRLLPPAIFSGNLSATRVARQFGMKERTLRKHLADDGTSFSKLAAMARFEVAQQLLRDTSMTIGDIAMAMNYSDSNAFTRAFRAWAADSPTGWRRREKPLSRGEPMSADRRTS